MVWGHVTWLSLSGPQATCPEVCSGGALRQTQNGWVCAAEDPKAAHLQGNRALLCPRVILSPPRLLPGPPAPHPSVLL